MSWRGRALLHFGAGMLAGVSFGDWLRLLRENRFAVNPVFACRAAVITLLSLLSSAARRYEQRRTASLVDRVRVHPPLFVIGHWRSGTTFLHNLLSLDPSFTAPNLFQTLNPHTFLTIEPVIGRLAAPLVERVRVVDALRFGVDVPFEDEFALAIASLKSPYLSFVFPRHARRYDRYLTLAGLPPAELEEWKLALKTFLAKLALLQDKPVVLKSPTHTARIAHLLDLFPDARFIHVHRNPYDVFSSTRHLMSFIVRMNALQRPDWRALDERILRQYRELYDAYLAQRSRIPAGHLHEVAFEALERDPLAEMQRAYECLGLPGFGEVAPRLEAYVRSLAGYRKNRHASLPPAVRRRINREWAAYFDAWGYPLET